MLIKILIFVFLLLIIHNLLLKFMIIRENLDNYKPYDKNDPSNTLILAQQNAGNIEVLKQQIDMMQGLSKKITDLSGNVDNLTDQVTQMIQTQQQYAQTNMPSSPPEITGTT